MKNENKYFDEEERDLCLDVLTSSKSEYILEIAVRIHSTLMHILAESVKASLSIEDILDIYSTILVTTGSLLQSYEVALLNEESANF